jgi:hypothetical protein
VKRIRLWIAGFIFATIAAASVSWTSPVRLKLVDESGTPAADAYVVFHYYGHLLNPVHPVTYVAGGNAIVRATSDGMVTIPTRVHLRRPLPLSTPPSAFIEHVYVPRLHNAFGPVAEQTMSRPGVFTIAGDRDRVVMADVSGSPEQWERSIRHLYDCIRDTLIRSGSAAPSRPSDSSTVAHVRELIVHVRREYEAFLEKYRSVVRQRPQEPRWGSERDRQLWREQTDAQLAREPLWGPYVERMWAQNLEEIASFEALLR